VAKVRLDPAGSLTVERVVAAVDCRIVVNPDAIRQQVESGIVFGLSAALYGGLTIRDGAVVEGNFDEQPVLRISECPAIEVHMIDSAEAPGGVGELGTPGVAPALLNPIVAAGGKRVRSLPVGAAARLGS
jgi:isoquinoline 1-oxidoreductase beta subunit